MAVEISHTGCVQNQRGNILFLILLAVVLFAALAYAVTSSMRGGGKDVSSENAQAAAATIMQWFSGLDATVLRMNVSQDIKYEDISFVYDAKAYGGAPVSNYMNNSRCTSDTCRVFKPTGGDMQPADFSKWGVKDPTGATTSSLHPGLIVLQVMQWPGAGTDKNDIVLWLYFMAPEICTAINEKTGITAIPNHAGTSIQGHLVASWDNTAFTINTNAAQLYGKDTYGSVLYGSGNGRFCHVVHLVMAR